MGPRSPLRSGRCRTDVPRTSCNPSSAWVRLLRGRRPWVQGLRFASVGAEQTSPGCLAVSAPLRPLQNRRPPDVLQPIFRMGSVVAWQAPMGPRSPFCFGRRRADVTPDVLHSIFRMAPIVVGQAGYTYSVQNCILDQKERTIL